jgi:hypothetical protein
MPVSINIAQHPMVEAAHKTQAGFKYLSTLYRGTLEKKLEQLYGRHTKTIQKTPTIKVWERICAGHVFNILSNQTGTRYEILYPGTSDRFRNDDQAGDACLAFLAEVYTVLTALGG